MHKTINKDLYLEIFNAFLCNSKVEYTPLDLGFCAFTFGVYEVVCVDLTLPKGPNVESHLLSISSDAIDTMLQEAFGSISQVKKVLAKINESTELLNKLLEEANSAYQKTMKLKFDSWSAKSGSLLEFLNLSDYEYINYLKNEH